MKISVRLVLPVVAIAAATSLVASAPAATVAPASDEEPGFVTVTTTDSLDPGSRGLSARCPRGSQLMGGGIWSGAAALGAVVQVNGPTGDRNWATQVDNVGNEALDARAYAICLTGDSPSQWIRRPFTVRDSGVWHLPKTATVPCPSGTRAIAGGVTTTPVSTDVGIVGQEPVDGPDNDKQRDDAVQFTYMVFSRSTAEFTALCARNELAQGLRYVRKSKAVGPGDQVSVTARCPSGTRVIGGGFAGPDDSSQILLSSMRPADAGDGDKKRDDAWQAVVDNYSASVKVTAYATCWTTS